MINVMRTMRIIMYGKYMLYKLVEMIYVLIMFFLLVGTFSKNKQDFPEKQNELCMIW